jgi:hypothetical protein
MAPQHSYRYLGLPGLHLLDAINVDGGLSGEGHSEVGIGIGTGVAQ